MKAKGGGNRKNSEESKRTRRQEGPRSPVTHLFLSPSFSCLPPPAFLTPKSGACDSVPLQKFLLRPDCEWEWIPISTVSSSSRRQRDRALSACHYSRQWVGKKNTPLFRNFRALLRQFVSCDVFTAFRHCQLAKAHMFCFRVKSLVI